MPPVAKLARWARSKGLNPYAVAKKIAEQGTERWRNQDNILGLNRQGELTRSSIVFNTVDRIVAETRKLKV